MMKKRTLGLMLRVFAAGAIGLLPLHGDQDAARKEKVTVVLQTMRDTAKQLVEQRVQQYSQGLAAIDEVISAQQKLRGVELRLAANPGERRKILAASLQAAKDTEKVVEARVKNGSSSQAEFLDAQLARMSAEIVLLEEGG